MNTQLIIMERINALKDKIALYRLYGLVIDLVFGSLILFGVVCLCAMLLRAAIHIWTEGI